MGLTATTARKFQLMSDKTTIEYELQKMAQSQMQVMNIMDSFALAGSNYPPDHPLLQDQQRFVEVLQRKDQRIQMLQEKKKQRVQAIDLELKALEKIIGEGMQQNFSYLGQG
jgi:hypothetical protein